MKNPKLWYHGTNVSFTTLKKDSYLTSSIDEACMYAILRTSDKGGKPNIVSVEVEDDVIEEPYDISPGNGVFNTVSKTDLIVASQSTVDDIFSQLGSDMKVLAKSSLAVIDITHMFKEEDS